MTSRRASPPRGGSKIRVVGAHCVRETRRFRRLIGGQQHSGPSKLSGGRVGARRTSLGFAGPYRRSHRAQCHRLGSSVRLLAVAALLEGCVEARGACGGRWLWSWCWCGSRAGRAGPGAGACIVCMCRLSGGRKGLILYSGYTAYGPVFSRGPHTRINT